MASSKSAQIVKSIREGQSDEYSLAGFDLKQVTILVTDAFTEPIRAAEMLRFVFTVGGGKNVRSKFDANLPRDMTAALRRIDYDEDRSASVCLDSQGSFKFQHNTDSDLKTITVFPRVEILEAKAEAGACWLVEDRNVLTTPPELMCAFCPMLTFVQLVVELCPTFSQRSALLRALKGVETAIQECDSKLASREQLSEEEEDLYANVDSLTDKISALQTQTQNMVTDGVLTRVEREEVIEKLTAKLETLLATEAKLDAKVKKEKKSGKKKSSSKSQAKAAKKLGKVREHVLQVNETLELLESQQPPPTPAPRRRGRNAPTGPPATPYQRTIDQQLSKLYNRRNQSFSDIPEVEHEIAVLEYKRAGWFPDARK